MKCTSYTLPAGAPTLRLDCPLHQERPRIRRLWVERLWTRPRTPKPANREEFDTLDALQRLQPLEKGRPVSTQAVRPKLWECSGWLPGVLLLQIGEKGLQSTRPRSRAPLQCCCKVGR